MLPSRKDAATNWIKKMNSIITTEYSDDKINWSAPKVHSGTTDTIENLKNRRPPVELSHLSRSYQGGKKIEVQRIKVGSEVFYTRTTIEAA